MVSSALETSPDQTSPEPGCFFWQRKKGNKKSKKGKKKCAKVASAPCPKVVSLPPLCATQMYRNLLQEQVDPPSYLQTANLSISYGAQVHKTSLSYELTDHERPPSRGYGRPGRRVEMDGPPSTFRRLVWMDLDPDRIDSLQEELELKAKCRQQALEARIMRAYRRQEQTEHIRQKQQFLMENATLSPATEVKVKPRRKEHTRQIENTRADTPAIPYSYQPYRSAYRAAQPLFMPGIDEAEDTDVDEAVPDKHLKAEQALRQAEEDRQAKILRRKERHRKIRERHFALEREKAREQEELEEYQTSADSRRFEVSNLRKTSAALDVSPAHQLAQPSELTRSSFHQMESANDTVAGGDTAPQRRRI